MKKSRILFLAMHMAIAPVSFSQTVYKCGNTFSDTKCSSDATIVKKSESDKRQEEDALRQKKLDAEMKLMTEALERKKRNLPPRAWGADMMGRIEESCKTWALGTLKDPNSAIFSNFTLLDKPASYYPDNYQFSVKTAAESVLFAAEVLFYVNAKNGFGGYTGDKIWRCLVDWESGRKVISVSSVK